MGNCMNRKYNKLSSKSIQNQELIQVTLKYRNGVKQHLVYPQSQNWINEINNSILMNHIHGNKFPSFEWTYSK